MDKQKHMGTMLYLFLICWLAVGVWLFIELCTYYRGLGWEDHKKSEHTAMYDSNVTYKP